MTAGPPEPEPAASAEPASSTSAQAPMEPEPTRPGGGFADGVRLTVTTFTVVPMRAGRVDRPAARIAMGLAPYLGLVLGAVTGGLVIGLHALDSPALLTGLLAVGLLGAGTRGLHLDGLADTADGLGAYRGTERALQIMKSPEVGPFGVVAIVLALAVPAACLAALSARPWWAVLAGVAAAVGCGRLAASFACRRGVPAARGSGLGALVAGTTGAVELALGVLGVAAVAIAAVPGRPYQGPLAVVAALAASVGLVAHARRRLGGITGDVLGACVEIATATTLITLTLGN